MWCRCRPTRARGAWFKDPEGNILQIGPYNYGQSAALERSEGRLMRPARLMASTAVLAGATVLVAAGGSFARTSPEARDVVTELGASGLREASRHHAVADTLVPRPDEGGQYGYSGADCSVPRACLRLSGQRAVVHWVTVGPDAPPLNDDDHNGIPDYVQDVRRAADESFAFYAAHAFKPPLPDTLGGDAKPDIYIKHFARTGGLLGLTFPQTVAHGGTFVIVGNDLDRDLEKVVGGLKTTVAHELFHVIQFSYVPNGEMPQWVAEGSASGMSVAVYPSIQDTVIQDYLDTWLRQTWRPLYDNRFSCDHCYGASLWWYFVFGLKGDVLPKYMGRLYGYQQIGRPLRLGTQPLTEIFKRKGYGSTFDVFTFFSRALYQLGAIPEPTYVLQASAQPGKVKEAGVKTVLGLSAHYIPLRVPSRARELQLEVDSAGGPAPDVSLIVGGPKGRVVKAKFSRSGRIQVRFFDAILRSAKERANITLIVTSGRQLGARYVVDNRWY